MDKPAYTRAEVDTTLCVFDDLISVTILSDFSASPDDISEYWKKVHNNFGTPGLRDASLEIGPKLEAVYVEMGRYDAFDPPFDFEVVPEFIRLAVETYNTHVLTHEQWKAIGLKAQANLKQANGKGAVAQ